MREERAIIQQFQIRRSSARPTKQPAIGIGHDGDGARATALNAEEGWFAALFHLAAKLKTFRIKGIPGPTGTIRGEMGVVKGPKSNLEIATIGAKLLDFDFEVGLDVVGFNLKVTGQPTVVVSGNRLNAQCKQILSRAGKGDQVTISEIKTKLVGAGSYLLPRTAPVIYEIQ